MKTWVVLLFCWIYCSYAATTGQSKETRNMTKVSDATSSQTPSPTLPANPDDICWDGKGHMVFKIQGQDESEPDMITIHEEIVYNITCTRKSFYDNTTCLQDMSNVTLAITARGGDKRYKVIEDIYYTRKIKQNMTIFHFDGQYELHHQVAIRCQIKNGSNIFYSKGISQSIVEKPKVDINPKVINVVIGDTFTITCTCSSASALTRLRWWKEDLAGDGTPVDHTGTITNITKLEQDLSSVLTVQTVEAWEGVYKCVFISTHNEKEEGIVKVKISKKSQVLTIVLITIGVVIVIVIAIVVTITLRKRQKIRNNMLMNMKIMSVQTANNNYDDAEGGDMSGPLLYEEGAVIAQKYAMWQKDRSTLELTKILGEGNFGSVMLGKMPDAIITGVTSLVAVKSIKGNTANDLTAILEFEKEMSVIASLNHKCIVNLVGICAEVLPYYIIMEYMENGQLNNFLVMHCPTTSSPDGLLSTRDLVYISWQPCTALEYLAANNLLHRDVSARNCLVGTQLTVKLADFGLSRDTSDNAKNYYKKEGGMVPVKWMAPEALTYGKYTTANDVWAFGVLMWEVFSFGAVPYSLHTNQQVVVHVSKGGRLARPELCPPDLYDNVMTKCWNDAPDDRITFSALSAFLQSYLEEKEEQKV